MEILNKTKTLLSSNSVNDFRVMFVRAKDQILLNSENVENNQLLVDLYGLMNQLQLFFDEPIQTDLQQGHLLTGGMECIPEGNSDKEMSSSTHKKGSNKQTIPKLGSKHTASFSSPKHISKQSQDSLGRPQCLQTPPSKPIDYQDAIQKYETSLKTISSLTIQKSELQQRLTILRDKAFQYQKQIQNHNMQKKQCLNLLVKQTEKNNKLDYQNKSLIEQLNSYDLRIRQLQEEIKQKGELLSQVQQYFNQQKISPNHNKQTTAHFEAEDQNQRLNIQLARLQEQLQIITAQNQTIKQEYDDLQESMDSLLRDNQQFYAEVTQLKQEVKQLNNKNRELIKIEQGKRINEMVHKENKHLLEVNYNLGNKIHVLETQNKRLKDSLDKVQNSLQKTYHKSGLNIGIDDTFNYTPKAKLSVKGSTADRFLQNSRGQTEDNEKSRYIEQSRKLERRNKQLQEKVQQLLNEVSAYQYQLDVKKREIKKLNITKQVEDRSQIIENTRISGEILQTFHEQINQQQFMSIKQFCQKYEASPMDTLFIMLRLSELSQSMLNNGVVYQLSPSNVFLILDDPDHPQNIFVKIEKQNSPKQSFLFIAPQIATSSIKNTTQSSVVWNMGMVFYYLLYKSPYFQNIQQIVDENEIRLKQQKFPEAESIIELMLSRNPDKRVQIKDLLEMIASQINKMLEQQQEGSC